MLLLFLVGIPSKYPNASPSHAKGAVVVPNVLVLCAILTWPKLGTGVLFSTRLSFQSL